MSLLSHVARHVARHGARVRRVSARHPSVRWMLVVAGATGFVLSVAAHRDDVADARAAWSTTTAVVRAVGDTPPGEPAVVEVVDYPVALVPPGAIESGDTAGFVARQHITRGEIVTEADVVRAPSTLIPADWLAVPIAESTASGARAGDRVVVVSDGVVLADRALVVEVTDHGPLVAVPADVAPLVALANATGVTLLRTPFVGP